MKTKSKTGLFYSDNTPILEGDSITLWHAQEYNPKPAKFVRTVEWSDDDAAYVASSPKFGISEYLSKSLRDVNCFKVTKNKR
jgi:hypothetical protein